MRIRKIQIRNFRKLLGPLTIAGLGDGVTVIAGDNEEGKSTLLLALRAALFVKHKISAGVSEELLPFGSKVRPELRLDLEFGGRPYSLYKAFYQNPRAELSCPTGRLEGSAAEEELARLLRFESPQKGSAEPKSEHQGLCGLLWLTQGESFLNQPPSMQLQRDLQSALEAEVGSVLTGELGRRLLDVFQKQHDRNFTKTGKPREELHKAQERVAALRDKLQGLGERLRDYDSKVDRLGELQATLRRYQDDETLPREQANLETQKRLLLAIGQREQALAGLRRESELLAAKLLGQQDQRRQRHEAREQLRRLARELDEGTVGQGLLATRRAESQAQLERLEKRQRSAQQQLSDGQAAVTALRRAVERCRIDRELAELQKRRTETLELEARKSKVSEELSRLLVDEKQLQTLREQAQRVRERTVELQAVATQLTLESLDQGAVLVDGQPYQGSGPLIVTEPTLIERPGQLRLVVTPGRSGASKLRQQLDAEQAKLSRALDDLGLPDVAAAEREQSLRSERLAELKDLNRQHERLCPEGVAALGEEVFRLDRKRQLLAGESSALPVDELGQQLIDQEAALAQKSQVATEALTILDRHRRELAQLAEEQAQREGTIEQLRREVARLTTRLGEEAARISDGELEQSVQQLEQQVAEVASQAAQLASEVAAAQPERVRQLVERLQGTVVELAKQIQATESKVQELAIELRTLGQQALHAELEETRAALGRAEVELQHKQRQAEAIAVLYESLQAHDRRAREAYLAPLIRLIEPYLQAILPGCRMALDEKALSIVGLRRGEVSEPFDSLSIGTREQLAVIVRLAVADLFAQRGQSVPIVLDDALVFCDDARFDRMLDILRHGGRRHQILILTCHERSFRRAGVPIIQLRECRDAA